MGFRRVLYGVCKPVLRVLQESRMEVQRTKYPETEDCSEEDTP